MTTAAGVVSGPPCAFASIGGGGEKVAPILLGKWPGYRGERDPEHDRFLSGGWRALPLMFCRPA